MKAQQGFSAPELRGRACERVNQITYPQQWGYPLPEIFFLSRSGFSLWADTHTNPLILVCGSTRLRARERKTERATPSTRREGRRESSWEREGECWWERDSSGGGMTWEERWSSTVNRSLVGDNIFILPSLPPLFPFLLLTASSFPFFKYHSTKTHVIVNSFVCQRLSQNAPSTSLTMGLTACWHKSSAKQVNDFKT